MVIRRSLNFPYENQKGALMFFPAGQDVTIPTLWLFLHLPSGMNITRVEP